MKEIAEYLCDEFVDFEGKVHKFVLCALSKVDPECDVTKDEFVIPSTRTVTLGVSVCNTADEYNEEFGKKIAYNRAASNKFVPAIVSTVPGVINTLVVRALLRQEADYIKRDPNSIIAGYDEKAKKFKTRKDAEECYNAMTTEEQMLVKLADKYDLDYYANLAKVLNK